jgi:hypothetical protein
MSLMIQVFVEYDDIAFAQSLSILLMEMIVTQYMYITVASDLFHFI